MGRFRITLLPWQKECNVRLFCSIVVLERPQENKNIRILRSRFLVKGPIYFGFLINSELNNF
jgi:hypothetical protein